MTRTPPQLREDALAIWQAGVEAVRGDRLVRDYLRVDRDRLFIGDEPIALSEIDRIVVVGCGKAGAGMAAGAEAALGDSLLKEKDVGGWVNVPADCVRRLSRVKLHAARPAGINEPTEQGVDGTRRILRLVESLSPRDLCLCLISGGGSALMPAPIDGITLADKQAVTKLLSAAGANIEQLNTVRKQLSRVKGGGLARACRAGRLVSLIISDVLGDPLDVIASGPTIEDSATPHDALDVLRRFDPDLRETPARVIDYLNRARHNSARRSEPARCSVTNLVLGNNAVAVDAAGVEAERRGYSHAMSSAIRSEGHAEDVGRHLADMTLGMCGQPGPDCLITGGEPVVRLVPAAARGKGGRNQQLVLAALQQIIGRTGGGSDTLNGFVLLSGGTDGEDGPTDAAGAMIDADVIARMRSQNLDPADFLARNDAYHFFQPLGGLIKTGPTHTNVCDVRVIVVDRAPSK